jgi:hypothetical protein
MAYTKLKNLRLLLDAQANLETHKVITATHPDNQRMVDYWQKRVEELTKRVYR